MMLMAEVGTAVGGNTGAQIFPLLSTRAGRGGVEGGGGGDWWRG